MQKQFPDFHLEDKDNALALVDNRPLPALHSNADVHPLNLDDFKYARDQVEKLTTVQEKTVEEKDGYEPKIEDLELQLESANNLKNESEMQLEKKGLEISEFLILIQNQKELETKSKEQEKTVEEKNDGYESKVKDLELQFESLNNLKSKSEIQLEKKGSEILELLILSQSLKEELENKSKEQEKTVGDKESFESKVKDLESQLENVANLKF
nr:COP1-interactive protein 1 [Tanacetum cinerariifolium]